MEKEKAFRALGLPETASLSDIKRNYRALVKRAHPDITHSENNAIRVINIAYETALEEYERRAFALSAPLSRTLETMLKGLRLAMKRYCTGLALARKSGISRAERLQELTAVLAYLDDVAIEERTSLYYTAISFTKNVIEFETLPVSVTVKTPKDRKAYFLYNEIVNKTVRVLEEVFLRLDGIKKRTGLWRYYIDASLEHYAAIRTLESAAYIERLLFIEQFYDDIKEIALVFRNHTSLLNYRDFWDLFKKKKTEHPWGIL